MTDIAELHAQALDATGRIVAGIMATFAWEKALGDANELAWWQEQTAAAASRQGIPADG
jgi:hypothetical protein